MKKGDKIKKIRKEVKKEEEKQFEKRLIRFIREKTHHKDLLYTGLEVNNN